MKINKKEVKKEVKNENGVTRFEGILVTKAEYSNKHIRFLIQPQKNEWIDIGQFEIEKAREVMGETLLFKNGNLNLHINCKTNVAVISYEQNRIADKILKLFFRRKRRQ